MISGDIVVKEVCKNCGAVRTKSNSPVCSNCHSKKGYITHLCIDCDLLKVCGDGATSGYTEECGDYVEKQRRL